MLDLGGFRRQLVLGGEAGILHGQPDEVELVLAVQYREVGLITEEPGRPAEQPVANVVKRPGPDLAGIIAYEALQPVHHLPRRAAGERDQQDRIGRDAAGDQVRDPIGDDPRFSRSRPGQDQVIPVRRHDRCTLRVIQILAEMLLQPCRQRVLERDLSHAAIRKMSLDVSCHVQARLYQPSAVFSPVVAKELSPIYMLLRHRSAESLLTSTQKLLADAEYLRKGADFLNAPADKPAFQRMESSLLLAFKNMPTLVTPVSNPGRVARL